MQALVCHKFNLSANQQQHLHTLTPNFGGNGFGEMVYLRTYSRRKENDKPENWADTVTRVTNGTFSILKTHSIKHVLPWDEEYWQNIAKDFSNYMFDMCFLPPGRGLWAMGTNYVNERGSMALNNCAFVSTIDLKKAAEWAMDGLMCGCGVGFDTEWNNKLYKPLGLDVKTKRLNSDKNLGSEKITYEVPDSREGWVTSMGMILHAYLQENQPTPVFDYSKVRPAGVPIKGFGGTSSGPGPLIKLHQRLFAYLNCYYSIQEGMKIKVAINNMILQLTDTEDYKKLCKSAGLDKIKDGKKSKVYAKKYAKHVSNIENKTYGSTRLIADIFNAIGACVVAGNVRRSAQIAIGNIDDDEFIKLKDFNLNPERSSIMWMSNNTVKFTDTKQFSSNVKKVVNQLKSNFNGEPGIYNAVNVQRHGRVDKYHDPNDKWTREQEPDLATGVNPCITGDTWIKVLKSGMCEKYTDIVKVKDLIGKQFIAMINGQKYRSTEQGFWSTGIKQVYEIDSFSAESIKATANHQFLRRCKTSDMLPCYNYQWTEVKDLRVGDYIAVDNGSDDYAEINSIKPMGEEEVYDCTIPNAACYIANSFISHNCGEVVLESFELCNLSEVFPSRCTDENGDFNQEKYLKSIELATIYASIVSLLPTHSPVTNQVIARNHRIGVSLSGVTLLLGQMNHTDLIDILKLGYREVRKVNTKMAKMNGVPASIRVTTVKPSGTISQLVGVPSGIHFPISNRYVIRTVRSSNNDRITKFLIDKGVPHEEAINEDNTTVFSFPLDQGNTRSTSEVTIWEQLELAKLMQHWWSDNSVSVTINYDPKTELNILEEAISTALPHVKSLSFLPKDNGTYKQAPYQPITKEKYEELINAFPKIDWSEYLKGDSTDGQMPRFCDGDTCLLSS